MSEFVEPSMQTSELMSVLETLDNRTRSELSLDPLAHLIDGAEVAKRHVKKHHPFLVTLVALLEGGLRMLEASIDPVQLRDKHRVGWLMKLGHPRRRYLERRFGSAVIARVEAAAARDFESWKPYLAVLMAELAPFLDAMAVVAATAAKKHADAWVDTLPSRPTQFADLTERMASRAMTDDDDTIEIVEWTPLVRGLLADRAPEVLRKYDGARYVLHSASPDAVSQAAHSITELIDRLVRTLLPKDRALNWCIRSGDRSLVREERGRTVASRRGQLFFLVQMICDLSDEGEAVNLRDTLVDAALNVRSSAQKLKHADQGEVDRPECERLLWVVEAILTLFQQLTLLSDAFQQDLADYCHSLEERLLNVELRESSDTNSEQARPT